MHIFVSHTIVAIQGKKNAIVSEIKGVLQMVDGIQHCNILYHTLSTIVKLSSMIKAHMTAVLPSQPEVAPLEPVVQYAAAQKNMVQPRFFKTRNTAGRHQNASLKSVLSLYC